jgi:hypothetical protein
MGRAWRNAYSTFMGKPEGKRPLGRSGHAWEDNIKMDLGEIGAGVVDWIYLVQDREQWRALVNIVMNYLYEPLDSIKCSEILEWLSNWWLLKKDSAPWS